MTTNEQLIDEMKPQHRLNRNIKSNHDKTRVYIVKYILNLTFQVNYKISM